MSLQDLAGDKQTESFAASPFKTRLRRLQIADGPFRNPRAVVGNLNHGIFRIPMRFGATFHQDLSAMGQHRNGIIEDIEHGLLDVKSI